jgi:hypothetical protein
LATITQTASRKFSKLFRNCFGKFRKILEFFRKISESSGKFSESFGKFRNVLESFGKFRKAPESSGKFRKVSQFFRQVSERAPPNRFAHLGFSRAWTLGGLLDAGGGLPSGASSREGLAVIRHRRFSFIYGESGFAIYAGRAVRLPHPAIRVFCPC